MSISANARAAFFAPATGTALLTLVTITHSQLAAPIRLVNNTTDITSNSNLFVAYPLVFIPPAMSADLETTFSITYGNVDPSQLLWTLRQLKRREFPLVTVQQVLSITPNVIERAWTDCEMTDIDAEDLTISASHRYESALSEPLGKQFTRQSNPGLYPDV